MKLVTKKTSNKKAYIAFTAAFVLLVGALFAFIVTNNTSAKLPKVEAVHTTAKEQSDNKSADTIGKDQPVSDGQSSDTGNASSPASVTPTTAGSNGPSSAVLAAVTNGGNTAGQPSDSSSTVTTPVTTPPVLVAPTVSVTAPAANATVSGLVNVTASASDDKAVSIVSFYVDGALAVTSPNAPYSYAWDTTKVGNGTHTLTAVATDSDNLSTVSAPVVVTVNNAPVTPPVVDASNLIPNPSFETSATGTTPDSWQHYNDASATATFTYLPTGHTGSKSVQVTNTAITTGGSDWYYTDVPVTAGQAYKFSDFYKSDVATEIDAETIVNGVAQYSKLADVPAATDWTQANATFTAPAGATAVSIYQVLAKVGTLTTDDYSLTAYTPTPFTAGLVSVTFDDDWQSQYDNAFPVMKALGLPATYYVISGSLDTQFYMTSAEIVDLSNNGNEIADHTVHHCDLTGQQNTDDPVNCPVPISTAQIQQEMAGAKTALEALTGKQVTDFAYPYGSYNATTIAIGQQIGLLSQRTVIQGLNTKDTFDATQLKMYEVDSNITVTQVESWIDQAVAQKAWLILTYHEVANTPSDPSDALYNALPADFQTEMNYLKSKGVQVLPVNQALTAVQAQ